MYCNTVLFFQASFRFHVTFLVGNATGNSHNNNHLIAPTLPEYPIGTKHGRYQFSVEVSNHFNWPKNLLRCTIIKLQQHAASRLI
jgi:hypothetical protein